MTIVRRAQPWLGTIVSIEIAAADATRAHDALRAAFAAIARVHRAMSPQEPASDVARFNRAARGTRIEGDPWTVAVLRRAARLYQWSDGVFDVALGTARGLPYRCAHDNSILKLASAGCIDLGGIAKGYAVDRAVVALRRCGVTRGLVNAGGDLRAFGPGAWPVVVRTGDDRFPMALELEEGAVATSVYRAGRTPFHGDLLVSPQTGSLHAVDRAVTVAASDCALADALTKVAALLGDAAVPLGARLGARIWLH